MFRPCLRPARIGSPIHRRTHRSWKVLPPLRPGIATLRIPLVALALVTGAGCAAYRTTPQATEAPAPASEQGLHVVTAERMLVRRGWLRLATDNVAAVAGRATALAAALGGYVHSARETPEGSVSITLRIPSASLEAVMDSIAALGEVESRRVSADDVTEQVVDLDARATTLRATRDRLRTLLEQAEGIPDVITVERELYRVQADLESLERRLLFLRASAALADLSIDAHRPVRLGPVAWALNQAGRLLTRLFVIR